MISQCYCGSCNSCYIVVIRTSFFFVFYAWINRCRNWYGSIYVCVVCVCMLMTSPLLTLFSHRKTFQLTPFVNWCVIILIAHNENAVLFYIHQGKWENLFLCLLWFFFGFCFVASRQFMSCERLTTWKPKVKLSTENDMILYLVVQDFTLYMWKLTAVWV